MTVKKSKSNRNFVFVLNEEGKLDLCIPDTGFLKDHSGDNIPCYKLIGNITFDEAFEMFNDLKHHLMIGD